jgi:MGT family glycosyltransferase
VAAAAEREALAGRPSAARSGCEEFRASYRVAHRELHASFSEFCVERGAPPLPADDFIHESEWLNLYLYPDEVDYPRAQPLGPTWHNLQTSVRTTDPAWELPQSLRDGEGPLVYLSLGSLGSADVELMRKLVAELAGAPYRIVVSKGPQHAEFELAENMAGEEFLPQTEVLPKADLVITHGGNNTVTECLHFGKPMVVLPIFWDQHDNAQRIDETGFGARLDTYRHSGEELTTAIDRLLADDELRARLAATSERLRRARGTERAADLLEATVREAGS